MSSTLKERLQHNSSAFDGLLSLIPAKYYYDDETQNQWKAKKKSKEENKQTRREKLDPESLEESEHGATASQVLEKKSKNAKPVELPHPKRSPQEAQEAKEKSSGTVDHDDTGLNTKEVSQSKNEQTNQVASDEEDIDVVFDDDGNEISAEIATGNEEEIIEAQENTKKSKQAAGKELREKLQAKIKLLKEKRKAPGTQAKGAPSSREAILEDRRRKAELKAQQKKRKLKEIEESTDDEEDDDDEDNEDSSDEDDANADGVLYQQIVFNDTERATSDLQNLRKDNKRGPAKRDLKAHLKIVQSKKQKLSQLDESKKLELKEKEKWNRTLALAEGKKLKDDEGMLKKAIKRKEAKKRKSEIEWQERKQQVKDSISAKQKRREENLQIRKDNKGMKRKQQSKQKRTYKSGISSKRRAGFEGRMKSTK